jgi:hypothetical protein
MTVRVLYRQGQRRPIVYVPGAEALKEERKKAIKHALAPKTNPAPHLSGTRHFDYEIKHTTDIYRAQKLALVKHYAKHRKFLPGLPQRGPNSGISPLIHKRLAAGVRG